MKKEFIPYEQALALKELGFDEPCLGRWWSESELEISLTSNYDKPKQVEPAPTFSQAFRWFREKYNIVGYINPTSTFDSMKISPFTYDWFIKFTERIFVRDEDFNTYEEAEIECLKKLIESVKK